MRVAVLMLAVVGGGLMLLGFQSLAENTVETTTATEYLLTDDTTELADPLSLAGGSDGIFELVGVSGDGTVIGYASTEPVVQTCLRLKDALGADGWLLDSDNTQGVLSFYRTEVGASFGSSLFVQCVAVGQGSSLVVKRW
ncbi:MAG: hypothetical protein LBU31_02100 [Coriobacteriales bacterium]|jgi:hypothetical protein|nr:hypothetical protein [Coriobacteriales bacterium]